MGKVSACRMRWPAGIRAGHASGSEERSAGDGAEHVSVERKGVLLQLVLTAVFSLGALPVMGFLEKNPAEMSGTIRMLSVLLAAVLLGTALVLALCRKLDTPRAILLVTAAGMGLRLIYILGTSIGQRQHDVYSFGSGEGHAGYIEYLYTNLRLPDFDPRTVFQFYHPPLHHTLAALWIRTVRFFWPGLSMEQAGETIQVLTMFYSGIYLVYTRKLFSALGLAGRRLIAAYTVVTFYPALIIMSGSINNDMLSVALMQGAFYHAYRWYREPRSGSILAAALCMGFGMMTKLSVGTASLAIAFLFLLKWVQEPRLRRRTVAQVAAFGVLCFPLALWWGIRNLVLFGVPVSYVPTLGIGSHQYIGGYGLFERLLDFSAYQFRSVYVAWGEPYFEHNVFIGLLKTATFGEQTLSGPEGMVYIAARAMLLINAVLALLVIARLPAVLLGRRRIGDSDRRAYLTIIFLTFLLAYIQFCLAYAHTCTQNARYATPLIWVGAIVIAYGVDARVHRRPESPGTGRGGSIPQMSGSTPTDQPARTEQTEQTITTMQNARSGQTIIAAQIARPAEAIIEAESEETSKSLLVSPPVGARVLSLLTIAATTAFATASALFFYLLLTA